MSDKKTKKTKEPDYTKTRNLPNRLAEFAQMKNGLSPDELVKLLESLERIDDQLSVTRRRPVPGKTISREVGGKQRVMSIAEAVEYEKKRVEAKAEKEKRIDELLGDEKVAELLQRQEVSGSIYPKNLNPHDIVRYVGEADVKLQSLDAERAKPVKKFLPREETVLDIMLLIKKYEAVRVAKRLAERQKSAVLNQPIEELEAEYAEWMRIMRGDPPPETEEEKAAREVKEEEQRVAEAERAAEEAARNFDKLNTVFTLVDDVTKVVEENPEAAASVVRQWIGEAVLLKS